MCPFCIFVLLVILFATNFVLFFQLWSTKGEEYALNSLSGIRGGIRRAIQKVNPLIDITKDHEFKLANSIMKGVVRQTVESGKDQTKPHNPISQCDMQKYRNRVH